MNRLQFYYSQLKKYGKQTFYVNNYVHKPEFVKVGKCENISKGVIFAPQGFGYIEVDGKNEHIPHSGRILIGDNVTIHENTVIVRATSDEGVTSIGNGTKIDTFVHIAHNVKIGENCLIISGAKIGGSCEIGNNVYIGLGALIRNKIKIGDNSIIGMGAVVVKDVPANVTVIGNPAKILK